MIEPSLKFGKRFFLHHAADILTDGADTPFQSAEEPRFDLSLQSSHQHQAQLGILAEERVVPIQELRDPVVDWSEDIFDSFVDQTTSFFRQRGSDTLLPKPPELLLQPLVQHVMAGRGQDRQRHECENRSPRPCLPVRRGSLPTRFAVLRVSTRHLSPPCDSGPRFASPPRWEPSSPRTNPVIANATFRKNPIHTTTTIPSGIHGATAVPVTAYHAVPSIPAAARRPFSTTGHAEWTPATKASTVSWRESG